MAVFTCARCDTFRDADDGCEEYGRTGLICADCLAKFPALVISHDYPPIPVRSFDWSAVTESYDGAPDAGFQPHGTGATRGEAVADLIDQLEAA